jgi:hypothetical protein
MTAVMVVRVSKRREESNHDMDGSRHAHPRPIATQGGKTKGNERKGRVTWPNNKNNER